MNEYCCLYNLNVNLNYRIIDCFWVCFCVCFLTYVIIRYLNYFSTRQQKKLLSHYASPVYLRL